ncbi:MAG: nucleotidyltransferase domain-containing protein [Bacteroidales bacterium]|nr:nucleotidyltransferase domain-containing protein [Bacteroidales bacterium]MDT8431283.1 nucleotidyltransferase domain-containing protein [Bacteroidales bacterium]
MYGLDKKDIEKILELLSKYPEIEKAIIYGSRAKGNYRDGSDIDLSLVGENLDLNTLLKIEHQVDDLLLPYKLDISLFHNIENNDLIDHIERVGIIFYTKSNK